MKKELKVGLFFISGAMLLVVLILIMTNFSFGKKGYTIYADFEFIGDLRAGAKVNYRGGYAIGRVDSVVITNDTVRVGMIIEDESIKLRKDARFAIYTVGMGLGEKYVLVTPVEESSAPFIEPGDVFKGTSPMSLEGALGSLGGITSEISVEDISALVKNISMLLHSVNIIVQGAQTNLVNTFEDLGVIVSQLRAFSEALGTNADTTSRILVNVDSIAGSLELAMKDLAALSKSLATISKDVESGKGTIGKIMYSDSIYSDLEITMKNLRQFSESLPLLGQEITEKNVKKRKR